MNKKLLCDQMFGSLAKWLRLFGFDTYYATDEVSDEELLKIADKQNRILITRDSELVIRAKKRTLPVVSITSTDLDTQLHQVITQINYDQKAVLSRCSTCNSPIQKIPKIKTAGNVPEKVYAHKKDFWYCKTCHKFYWEGSHYDKIQKKIEKIKKREIKK